MAGPFAPVAVPVLALVGGGLGAWCGDEFAKWVVHITCTEKLCCESPKGDAVSQ